MTKRIANNSLYEFLRGAISNALPLEYAIRASELISPDGLEHLRQIDQRIKDVWLDLGASDDELRCEMLMDYAWDCLQIGFPLVRRHGRTFHPDMLALIRKGVEKIPQIIQLDCNELDIPAIQFFRICDLLNGNVIQQLMTVVDRCLLNVRNFGAKDEIKLSEFPNIRIREPVHLHPGMKYVQSNQEWGGENLGILLDLNADFTLKELERQVQEFLYQFAIYRESVRSRIENDLASEVISEFLRQDVRGKHSENSVERLDGFASVLSGLYCWDQCKRKGLKFATAMQKTQEIYPKSEEAVLKNYRATQKKIKMVKEKFIRSSRLRGRAR